MANEPLQAPAIEAVAMARHVRMSPQKVRLVVDLIRGQRAEDALQILRFTKKRATRDVEKVLRSASHVVVGVAEHHVAAAERVAAAAAEAESQKGVAGAVKKARQALAGKKKPARAAKKKK